MKTIRILTRPYDRKFTAGQIVRINDADANSLIKGGDAEPVGDDVTPSYIEPEPEVEETDTLTGGAAGDDTAKPAK